MSTVPEVPEPTLIPLADVRDPTKNPNHMPQERFELLVSAIQAHGFLQPILVRPDGGGGYRLIDGFHRCKAARMLGLTDVSAVVVESEEAAAKVLQIGMNRLRGELNLSEVADVLVELSAGGMDVDALTTTGFSKEEIDGLMERAHPDEDDALGEDYSLDPSSADTTGNRNERPFVLELTFPDGATLKKVRRKLKKAAGKGNSLEDGLINVLDGN